MLTIALAKGRLQEKTLERLSDAGVVVDWDALGTRRLAVEDADLICSADWDALLYQHLPPGTGEPAFLKTRSTLQRALGDAGVLDIAGNTTRTTRVCRGRPDPLAYAWLIAHELRCTSRTEAPEVWALHHAFPARLFAPSAEYAAVCVDAGVGEGILRRGYLAGEPRLHPGEDV